MNPTREALLSRDDLAWLTDVREEQLPAVNSAWSRAEEFGDEDLEAYVKRWLMLRTAIKGKRTDKIIEYHTNKEAVRRILEENRVPGAPDPDEEAKKKRRPGILG